MKCCIGIILNKNKTPAKDATTPTSKHKIIITARVASGPCLDQVAHYHRDIDENNLGYTYYSYHKKCIKLAARDSLSASIDIKFVVWPIELFCLL